MYDTIGEFYTNPLKGQVQRDGTYDTKFETIESALR